MAKDKAGAVIKFIVNDDGSLSRLGKQAKKTKGEVDKLGKSEATLNRNFKGASRQSSNQTKNFSKMAQGITGGLVPAYATLAANIFAIGAAFRFLQNAGDLRILQQGQAEYAQRTGQNLAIMTRQLQAATDGQLAFAEAAQSVAIGTAAGLATKQINQLGIVAKNASLMLGRDLTDSFNRLVRGAVKAEPELLDELGIILRLETASEKYALSIGKTKDQLNIFEKSQAVVNEVLAQGLEKFGGVETQTNELSKLAKAFDDLVNSLKRAIGPMAEFMATALQQNTLATAGIGILTGTSLLRALTPTVPAMNLGNEVSGMRETVGQTGMLNEAGKAKFGKLQTQQDLKNFERSLQAKKSKFLNYTTFTKSQSKRMVLVLKAHNLEMQADQGGAVDRMKNKFLGSLYLMQAEYGRFVGTMKFLGRGLSTAISFLGYAGVLISVFGILKQFMDRSDEAEKKYTSAQKVFGDMYSRNAEDLESMVQGMKTYDSALSNALQSARALTNIDFSSATGGLGEGFGGYKLGQDGASLEGFRKGFYDILDGMGMLSSDNKLGVTYDSALSGDQTSGLQGFLRILEQEKTLLLAGSEAHKQHTDGIERLTTLLANPTSQTAFDNVLKFTKGIEDGTIASKDMNNLAQTTQIMASSAQDFNKALNSFKAPQTQLTRLTTNIRSVGEALTGVSEAFTKENIALKFNADSGTLFDKATLDMLTTFLSPEQMEGMQGTNSRLRALSTRRDEYKESGNTEMYDKTVGLITTAGSKAFSKYGALVEAEAERLHQIEMGMIKDKTKVQTNLTLLSVGATIGQAKRLKMEGASAQNLLQQTNQLTLIEELKIKTLDKDDAQVQMEQGKLDLLVAQGIQLDRNLDRQLQITDAMKQSLETGLASTFDDLMTGKNSSLSEGMANVAKGVFESVSKQLSDQMATGVTNFLFGNKELEGYQKGAEIIKQAHIDGINAATGNQVGDIAGSELDGSDFGKFVGKIASFVGLAKGGISPVYAASGGVFSGSKGGYPATLHGNEAVVPLPDGKSIPISGNLGGTVNVAVNMTTGETSSTSDSADMVAMGESIAQAVQNEIDKQQRPGGQLSPY
jgi:hypothetical protein